MLEQTQVSWPLWVIIVFVTVAILAVFEAGLYILRSRRQQSSHSVAGDSEVQTCNPAAVLRKPPTSLATRSDQPSRTPVRTLPSLLGTENSYKATRSRYSGMSGNSSTWTGWKRYAPRLNRDDIFWRLNEEHSSCDHDEESKKDSIPIQMLGTRLSVPTRRASSASTDAVVFSFPRYGPQTAHISRRASFVSGPFPTTHHYESASQRAETSDSLSISGPGPWKGPTNIQEQSFLSLSPTHSPPRHR